MKACPDCGYDGPPADCALCRAGSTARACAASLCVRCGALLPGSHRRERLLVERAALLLAGLLCLVGVAKLFCGCSPEFSADDFTETAGAAGNEPIAGAGAGGQPSSAGSSSTAGSSSSSGAAQGGSAGAVPGKLCARSGWRVSAFAARADEPPAAMLDGDQNTRWSSGQSQIAEQWLELEFGRVELLELLELRTAAGDMPRELELELDGAPASQTSSMAVPGVLRLELEQPTAASSARIAIVTPAANALAWWSVTELGGLCR